MKIFFEDRLYVHYADTISVLGGKLCIDVERHYNEDSKVLSCVYKVVMG